MLPRPAHLQAITVDIANAGTLGVDGDGRRADRLAADSGVAVNSSAERRT